MWHLSKKADYVALHLMNTRRYEIKPLVWLGRDAKEAADFVSHCSPTDIGQSMALAYLRHQYGANNVTVRDETIIVVDRFLATPISCP